LSRTPGIECRRREIVAEAGNRLDVGPAPKSEHHRVKKRPCGGAIYCEAVELVVLWQLTLMGELFRYDDRWCKSRRREEGPHSKWKSKLPLKMINQSSRHSGGTYLL
jgi:hypothetical protein